ncbi:glycosyltransferase family 4 protein [Arthrobacter sp. MPF02]|uniref:glycosyltransferase family 4 protein n=1 Tax=Arthrobacter sp. MPF02 TaxID=3388492 RepID=UPI0039851EBB
MREPYTRPGGLHSYVRGLVSGQISIGLKPIVVDSVSASARFNVAQGVLPEVIAADGATVAEYHFAHSAFPFLSRPWGPWKEAPRLFHFHGPWHQEGVVQGNGRARVFLKKAVESVVYKGFSRFIVASDAFGNSLAEQFGVEREKITTVYPGVDTDRFSTDLSSAHAREVLDLPSDTPIAAVVRRLEPRMGVADAIVALQSMPDLYLIIAGTGSLNGELQSLVRDLRLTDRVRFLGRVSDEALPLVYRAADVSIVPTRELEGFGMIVLESMACGTPVVATRVGGLPEAMGPFADECSVNPREPKELASKVLSVLDKPSLRREVRSFAESRSNEEMARKVEGVVQQLLR